MGTPWGSQDPSLRITVVYCVITVVYCDYSLISIITEVGAFIKVRIALN